MPLSVLLTLGTDPEYRRRGIATMMMDPVIKLADQEGRKIYIEATSDGRPLYQKYGFRDIDLITMDLRRWGGEGPEYIWVMMREPKAKR
jgi:ribosomal protein S18 acetylase RimI-like enzyme